MIKIKKPSDSPPPKQGGFGWKLLSSFFGVGFSPLAPGTVSSACVFILIWFVPNDSVIYLVILAIITVAGIPISGKAENYWGKDPSKIVIDEVAGSMVALLFVPKNIWLWIIAFVAFRGFDILKLPPAKTIEKRFRGGWGVMLDDIVAGVYAFVLTHLVSIIFQQG